MKNFEKKLKRFQIHNIFYQVQSFYIKLRQDFDNKILKTYIMII